MKRHLALAVLLGLAALSARAEEAAPQPAPAAAPAAAAPAAAPVSGPEKAQQTVQQVCGACHGMDGNSLVPVNPSLAGQHAAYVTRQLAAFKSGERKNPIMMGMAAMLSPEDMQALGTFFATQKAKPGQATDKALALAGQKIYRGGNAANGVPACASCHAPNGAGIPAQFPRLAGQHADYTEAQLKAFRSGERAAGETGKMMAAIAARLSDQEIKALAQYVQGLQ